MYPTLIGLNNVIFAATITVICPCRCPFNIILWHHASGWTYIHPWKSPQLWSMGNYVILSQFICTVYTLFSALATCFCNETLCSKCIALCLM